MATVLVVDDTDITHWLLDIVIQRNHHKVVSAFNGSEALKCMEQEQIDLVITDINMPEKDGLVFLEEVRANDEFKNVPIIVLTASPISNIHEVAAQKGATAFIYQPFSTNEIKLLLDTYLS